MYGYTSGIILNVFGTGLLSKAFALLLLVIGLRELSFGFSKKRKEENSHSRYNTPRTLEHRHDNHTAARTKKPV